MSELSNGWLGATSPHWDVRAGDGVAKAILTYLKACEGDSSGEVWPSLERIAEKTEFCVSAVQGALRRLKRRDHVESRLEKKAGGGFRSRYRLKTVHQVADTRCDTPGVTHPSHLVSDTTAPGATHQRSKKLKLEGEGRSNPGGSPQVRRRLSDDEFVAALKDNPAYRGIGIDIELGKMDAWFLAHPGRLKTQRFVVNWLNKIDRGMAAKPKRSIVEGGQPVGFLK